MEPAETLGPATPFSYQGVLIALNRPASQQFKSAQLKSEQLKSQQLKSQQVKVQSNQVKLAPH